VPARVDNSLAWAALLLSGCFEVGWIVSLKSMDGLSRPVPLVSYLLTGLGASIFLSVAMRSIPMATAYSVWVGVSIVGALAIDVAVFKEPWTALRGACALLIVAGACGLRLAAGR
jgi:quaternary ammonium compound-resistance protein SugE